MYVHFVPAEHEPAARIAPSCLDRTVTIGATPVARPKRQPLDRGLTLRATHTMFAERTTSWIIERDIGDEPIAALLEAAIRRDDYWMLIGLCARVPFLRATRAEADRRQHGALLRGKSILAAAAVC